MKVDSCYQLGEVVKTHGLNGELIIRLDVDSPIDYQKLESVFLEREGKLIPFFISSVRIQGEMARVKIDEVDDQDTARPLVGSKAFLPLSFLPDLGSDAYYFHELVGFKIIQNAKVIGELTDIYDQERNPMFGFRYEIHEVLVPFQDEFVKKVDKASKEIHINLPEGYLEIYMES